MASPFSDRARLAGSQQAYSAFHDITIGTNGAYVANKNWDEVTGWDSPDLYNLARDLAAMTNGAQT